jgi:Na+/H+ antiporter family
MAILFPLILVPTYQASNGDPLIFYSTVAGVLSGSVAGDHASPISDTTVLSALASDCALMAHVATQAPYAAVISVLSVIVGTLPIGYDAWPNMIGMVIGWFLIVLFAIFYCRPAVNKDGSYDFVTEMYLKCKKGYSPLEDLRHDTIEKYESYQGQDPNAIDWRFWKWRLEKKKSEKTEEEDTNEEDKMEKAVDESVLADDELYVQNESVDYGVYMESEEPGPKVRRQVSNTEYVS